MRIDETIDAIELYYAQGWTDGLPVVPPTRAKVQAMVERSGRAASEMIAELPPQGGKATVERIATNAVMAGCVPEYMPVILTALEAMLETRFNLRGVLCSTHVSTPLLILNGPIVQALHVNSGHNVFGPGWRANATIGRAVQLALVNIGGRSLEYWIRRRSVIRGSIRIVSPRTRRPALGAAARGARIST